MNNDVSGYYVLTNEDVSSSSINSVNNGSNIPDYKKAKENATKIMNTGINIETFNNMKNRKGISLILIIFIVSCLIYFLIKG